MRECFVGFSHTVHFFTFLDGGTAIFSRIHQLTRQADTHGFFTTLARSITQPSAWPEQYDGQDALQPEPGSLHHRHDGS